MAENIQKIEEKKRHNAEEENEILVRILGCDIPASRSVYAGLTRIKGISWAISNVVCLKLKIPRNTKISELSKPDIAKIEEFLKKLEIPDFLKNRRLDLETGHTGHYFGVDLDMKKEFDIKRLKKIKSYKGIRHTTGQPVRGQRTRSHFRSKHHAVGIKRIAK